MPVVRPRTHLRARSAHESESRRMRSPVIEGSEAEPLTSIDVTGLASITHRGFADSTLPQQYPRERGLRAGSFGVQRVYPRRSPRDTEIRPRSVARRRFGPAACHTRAAAERSSSFACCACAAAASPNNESASPARPRSSARRPSVMSVVAAGTSARRRTSAPATSRSSRSAAACLPDLAQVDPPRPACHVPQHVFRQDLDRGPRARAAAPYTARASRTT